MKVKRTLKLLTMLALAICLLAVTANAAEHSVSNWTPVGDGTHKGICDQCSEEIAGTCSGDSSANCSTPGTCTQCGGTYTREDHHAYSWKSKDGAHWQECANNADHKINTGTCAVGDSGRTATCSAAAVCGTCGKSFGQPKTTAHVWGGWTHGEIDPKHSRVCTLDASHTETNDHNFDWSANAGQLYGTCETCGYKVEAKLMPDTGKSTVYCDRPLTPLTIRYSSNWLGEKVADSAIVYSNHINAGTATGKVTIAGVELVCNFTITPAPLTINSATAQNRVYDGTREVSITGITFSGKLGNDDVDIKKTNATISSAAVGEYNTVTLPAASGMELLGADKGNYTIASHAPFQTKVVISPKEVVASVKATDSVYGKVTTPVISIPGLVEQDKDSIVATYKGTTEKVVDGQKVKYESSAVPTDAGSYTVAVTLNNRNYKLSGTTTASFKIAKAAADYDAPQAIKLNYNGKEQELVTAGVIRGSTRSFQYKRENDTSWGATIPTAKNVCTDVVMWRYEEDANHLGASGKVEVEIEPAVLTVIPDANQKHTYGKVGAALTYKVKGTVSSEVPVFSGELEISGEDAGTYEIKLGSLKLKDKDSFKAANYEIKLEKVEYVINRASLQITAEDQIITFGAPIDGKKYTITDLADDDTVTVTLTPSTTGVTYGGTITPSIVIKGKGGLDVSQNYNITRANGKLVIEPDFAVIEGITTQTVSSAKRDAIEKLQESLNKADTEKASSVQKKRIEDAKATCTALLEQIEKAAEAKETDAIKQTADITADNVKLTDEAVILQAIEDIEKAKEAFSQNYTAEELKKLDEQITRLKGALETGANAKAVIEMLSALPETVKAEDAGAAEARAALKNLTAYELELVKASDSGKRMDAVAYKILSGNGDLWERGKHFSFTVDGDYDRFVGIKIDGSAVGEKFYDAESGSTVVTLKKGYLKKLSREKNHTITFLFDDGEIDGVFHTAGNTSGGGFAFMGLLICLILLATAAGAAFLFIRRRNDEE